MTIKAQSTEQKRQHAMRIFSQTDAATLEQHYEQHGASANWKFVRKPETGLVMARGRIGGGGKPFNLGEVTVTRAAVMLESGETGHAYCLGRDQKKAAIIAVFDAALQSPQLSKAIENDVLGACEKELQQKADQKRKEAAATKVDFFTMTRGDD